MDVWINPHDGSSCTKDQLRSLGTWLLSRADQFLQRPCIIWKGLEETIVGTASIIVFYQWFKLQSNYQRIPVWAKYSTLRATKIGEIHVSAVRGPFNCNFPPRVRSTHGRPHLHFTLVDPQLAIIVQQTALHYCLVAHRGDSCTVASSNYLLSNPIVNYCRRLKYDRVMMISVSQTAWNERNRSYVGIYI